MKIGNMSWNVKKTAKNAVGGLVGGNIAGPIGALLGSGVGGVGDGLNGLNIPTMNDLTGKTAADDAAKKDAEQKAKYNSELERIFSRENRFSSDQIAAQDSLAKIMQGQLYASLGMPMPEGTGPEGQALWQAMQKANAMQRGQEQSALSTGYQNSSRNLMNQNRQLFGSGSSGHIAGQLGNLQTQYMMQRPQVAANYNTRQTANQQGTLQNYMSMAYGQPMGNQPYQPAQQAAPFVNTFLPDLFKGLVNTGASAGMMAL